MIKFSNFVSSACRVVAATFLALTTAHASASVLGDVAAQMQPGQWVKLNSNGDASGLSFDLFFANPGTVLGYLDKAKWDALGRRVYFVGQGHDGVQKFIQYDEGANRWSEILPKPYWDSSATQNGHGYQHNTINPANGDLYYRIPNSTRFFRLDRSNGQWSELPKPSISYVGFAGGLEYFPEMNGLVYVGRSTVAVFRGGAWTTLNDGTLTMGEYHNVAQYSKQHGVVYLGGGNGSRIVYKINSNLAITRIPDAPVEVAVASSVTTVDPVTGNLLVMDASGAYQYAAPANAWSNVTMPGSPITGAGVADTTAIPIATYGVIMFIRGNAGSPAVWLYKHSPSSTGPIDTTPPAPPTGITVN